jgi:hypothetical protein
MAKALLPSLIAVAVLCAFSTAPAADALPLKCPVCGKAASPAQHVAHNGAVVEFCSADCAKAFAAHADKFAAKANLQLVASGQFKEVKCPLEGYALNPKASVLVGGLSITFCCKGCRNVVSLAKGDEQIDLVFSDKAFKKGFEKVEAAEKK